MNGEKNRELLSELMSAQETGTPVVMATIVRARGSVPRQSGSKMLIYEDGRISGTIGGGEMESRVIEEAQDCLSDGQTRVISYSLVEPERGDPGVCGGEVEIYLELYAPPATILVIGCGHVGKAVASLAYWLGYQVVLSDDRAELVTPENIPEADVYVPGDIDQLLEQVQIHSNTFVALLTRNVALDRQILPRLIETAAPYIGVIGSRRRWEETRKLLLADGFAASDLARFHSPIGLELNAETPEEIAVSVMAEIIMLRRGGTGQRMREQQHARIEQIGR